MQASTLIQRDFIFFLYLLLRMAAFPFLVLYFLYRGYRDRRYFHRFTERLGALPLSFKRTPPGGIWLHAVSVGEVISSIRLIEELRRVNAAIPIYLSTTTLAGRAVAEQKAAKLTDGLFFAPVDYSLVVRRVVRTIRPAVVVVLETEIWPVLYREVQRAGCGLLILNGRISDRTLPRYRRLRWAFAPVLAIPEALLVQSERDRVRYLEAGAPSEKVRVMGNLKYDAPPPASGPPKLVARLIDRLRPQAIWIAASTMPGIDASDVDEDDVVIAAFQELAARRPQLLTILAPRRPERFTLAATKLGVSGVAWFRRSADRIPDDLHLPCVLLLDSLGELASLFPVADVVFLGGTLARRGGHNVLEPALCGKPVVVGPHMENFAAIAEDFRAHGGWFQIAEPAGLAAAVENLLDSPERRAELGRRAAELASGTGGVAGRAAEEILKLHDRAIPRWDVPGPSTPLLWLLAQLWKAGNRIKQTRDVAHAQALEHPVISVGGLSMGGSGKTPFVEMLSKRLGESGFQPAILTRGYRRRSLDRAIVIGAGTQVSTCYTGDEAQIFVQSGYAHIGIGSDRWSTGRLMENKLEFALFLLDDGFQHRRLRRDLDIVLIDALNPFPGGDVFPLGQMREPLAGLKRAHVFVITRGQPGRNYAGIRAVLRSVNPSAPIYQAAMAPRGWMCCSTQQPAAPPPGPVAAFCALGNPDAFWQTLREQQFDPVFTWTFADHHRYRPRELRRLAYQAGAHRAGALLTTEKDMVNLPENVQALVAPLEIYWLKIETVVREEAELLRTIEDVVRG